MNTFASIFDRFLGQASLPQALAEGEVRSLDLRQSRGEMTVHLQCGQTVGHEALALIQEKLAAALGLQRVHLRPAYPAAAFDTEYFAEIVWQLKQQGNVVNGFFEGAEPLLQDEKLSIRLKNGGLEILTSAGVDRAIAEIIRREFGLALTVEFCGQTTVDESCAAYQALKKELEAPIPVQQQAEKKKPAAKAGVPLKSVSADCIPEGLQVEEGSFSLLVGKPVKGTPIPLKEVTAESGNVVVWGDVFFVEKRLTRDESRVIYSVYLTDYTSSNILKIIADRAKEELYDQLKNGVSALVRGEVSYDRYDREINIRPFDICLFRRQKRMDHSEEKRVELHVHTTMSAMDAVSTAEDIINQAYRWGHKAIAITDHGVAQAFPDAMNAVKKIQKGGGDFKVIYGVEDYFVNDTVPSVYGEGDEPFDGTFIVFDLETTGLSAASDRMTEIGAVKVRNGEVVEEFNTFVNPQRKLSAEITQLTSITDEMLVGAPLDQDAIRMFFDFCGDCKMLVAHNATFDASFLKACCSREDLPFEYTYIDTVAISRQLYPELKRHKLDLVAKHLGLKEFHHHRACDDARVLADIFILMMKKLSEERDAHTVKDLRRVLNKADAKSLPVYHQILLVKNLVGLKNLYKLISFSHINYFYKKPRIPKSVLQQYREGLLVGSACEQGELYRAVAGGRSWGELCDIARFYDYLEIQPLGNNEFMVREGKVESRETLKEFNKTIVKLGKYLDIPVVATCDVHFLNPEDSIFREVIMAGQGFKDASQQPPLYLRTTEEMLAEFDYLGEETARQVVIENPNRIADMIEQIKPIPDGTYTPSIEGAEETLTEITWGKAKEIYGDPLPDLVAKRLDRELTSIIKHGFAVLYVIAQKLVWKSVEDGYLVGSRGSVGSSFVATMAGITEVNPLPPHYYCPSCHYSDFGSEDVKKYAGAAGCDMPDKACPVCGTPLKKEGFDIPFETFLGFKGDKEPDIDLNFSGDYQSKAHKYTEVIFGKGQTFRAGTIGTLADKTAFGYVKNYYEERGQHKRNCEIDRIVQGCVGVRRSTGQHPGGIVVLPHGEEIHSFTPIQHPANDMTTDIITTHFDYHSIDHNLLKLDILGHDDPTMIRMLEDLTGIDAKTIPLDDKGVMSLFKSTEALGITPEDIDGCPLGCLGIPEFGTDFVIQMVVDAKPQSFSDLIRISGLSHGTDVWLNNAQRFIKEGKATISTAICTRDDIMLYLIQMGVEPSLSFTIMESVRKGKGLKPEWIDAMKAAGVEDWYIESCKMIKYMFPKAHAAAYVMMAWRIAYCKINYPLAYYAAYFSIRASAFSYELMCQGKERLAYYMADYKRRSDSLSKKEQDTLKDMHIVQEMYARGFEFLPIDIYKAKAHHFQIIDGKLMPALSTIEGLGDKAADQLFEAAKNGPFLSKDDLRARSKLSKTVIDLMGDLGLLGDMPESNQLSLFDFV